LGVIEKGVAMKFRTVQVVVTALILVFAYIAGQHSSTSAAAQSRQKWEYEIVGSSFSGSGQVDKLNKLGEEGWEVVTLNASNRVLLRRAK
jgi:hypothetical protein